MKSSKTLAEQIFEAEERLAQEEEEDAELDTRPVHKQRLRIELIPDKIRENCPSLYMHYGILYHEHTPIKPGDNNALLQMVDDYRARVDQQASLWIYNRLRESAPVLSSRYILLNKKYAWDKNTAQVVRIKRDMLTTKDSTTKLLKELYRRKNEQSGDARRVGQSISGEDGGGLQSGSGDDGGQTHR